MQKIISVLIIAILLLSFCSCKKEDNEKSAASNTLVGQTSESAEPQETPEPEAEKEPEANPEKDAKPEVKPEPEKKPEIIPEPEQMPDESSQQITEDVFTKLKNDYPDSEIIKTDTGYNVISDNVDFTKADEKILDGTSESVTFNNLDDLLKSCNFVSTVIFIGKKTGQTRQLIPVNNEGLVDDLCYTDSKVKVITPLYGDISKDDVIILSEFYAVFEGSSKSILRYMKMPLSNDETLYICGRNFEKSLYGTDENYFYPITDATLEIEQHKSNFESKEKLERRQQLRKDLYEKYVVSGDTAINRQEETEKAEKYLQSMDKSAKLTDEQLATIDALCKKYGEK